MSNTFLTVNEGSFLSQCIYLTEGKTYKVRKFFGENVVFYDDAGNMRGVDQNQITLHYFPETLKVKQNIFTHPKWVTAKETDLEIGLVADRDYLVTRVEEDRYWVENPSQSNTPVWYKKERFYKVTPEDLLPPKKKSVEHIDEGFDGLVYVAPEDDCLIYQHKLSRDQASFVYNTLKIKYASSEDTYLYYDSTKGWWNGACGLLGLNLKLKNFNDIFKRV